MSISKTLRLKWALSTKSLKYGEYLLAAIYKKYLNHDKVIFWKEGLPVYSGSTPPAFSKPAAHMAATIVMQAVQNKKLPNLMSFAVNDVCNANCGHCSFFEGVYSEKKQVISLSQAQNAIEQAQDLGVSVVNFVGGEPLMSPDICEIIRSVDKDRSITTMFTNGWYLEEKAHDLHAAGLDTIYVSIDSADPETHDAMRKLKGLYGRSMDGIRQAKKIGLMTGLSSCIYEEDIENGNLERLIELGKELGVQEHVIFDAMPSGRLKKRSDLMKRGDWIATLEKKIEPYNKDDSYPGILIYGYVTSHKSSGCACGVSTFYLSPYGDISSCDFNPQPVGNITQDPLYRIWERFATMPNFKSAAWGGCKVKDPEFQAKMKNEGSLASQEQDAIIDDNDGSCACDANACR